MILNKGKHFVRIGRTRLEPIIIIILSIVMCAANFQVILEGVRSVVEDINYFRNTSGYAYEKPPVDINPAAITIMCITVGTTGVSFFCQDLSDCFYLK